jgi:hypothetical protein
MTFLKVDEDICDLIENIIQKELESSKKFLKVAGV